MSDSVAELAIGGDIDLLPAGDDIVHSEAGCGSVEGEGRHVGVAWAGAGGFGAVGGCWLADPEALAVGIDVLVLDVAARVDGEEGEGGCLSTLSDRNCGGDAGEGGCEESFGIHIDLDG